MILIVIVFVLLLIFSSSLFSQQDKIEFQHVSYEFNLPHNAINTIYQDNMGFLWVGTKYGLDVFDGYKFRSLRRNNKFNSLSSDNIKVVLKIVKMIFGLEPQMV